MTKTHPESHMYSIRDRLLNFYMRPFTAPSDQEAQAAIAFNINSEEIRDAVTQAPHHFELWRLATIEENGTVIPNKELVCDCASLVRRRLRDEPGPGNSETPHGLGGSHNPPERPSGAPRAETSPIPTPAQG